MLTCVLPLCVCSELMLPSVLGRTGTAMCVWQGERLSLCMIKDIFIMLAPTIAAWDNRKEEGTPMMYNNNYRYMG